MNTQPRTFAMITTRGSFEYNKHALASFYRNTQLQKGDRFLLIDNDGYWFENNSASYPLLETHVNLEPRGFAENANFALKAASEHNADLYLLNNDIIFTPHWLAALQSSEAAILTPLSNREVQFAVAVSAVKSGAVFDLYITEMNMSLEQYIGNESYLDSIAIANRKKSSGYLPVICLPFYAVRIPQSVYKQIGAFDTDYGKGGGEDYDYCLRAVLAGFKVQFALGSYLLHFGGKSSWSGVETPEQQLTRENIFFSHFEKKWGPELLELILKENNKVLKSLDIKPEPHSSAGIQATLRAILGEREKIIQIFLPLS